YDGKIPNEARVAQVIDWLKLPPEKRPHLITLYFSDADDAGHHFGPDSAEVRDAVGRLDRLVGTLTDRLKELNLPVNVVIVSDHGMVQLKRTPIALDAYLAPNDLPDPATNVSPIDLYADSPEQANRWYNALHNRDSRFQAYRRADVPAHLHYSTGPRIGDIVLIRREPEHLFDRLPSPPELAKFFETHIGDHGFDPALIPDMKGIFYAQGPNIRAETRIAPPESIEIYPLVARILGLNIVEHVDASGKIAKAIYQQ
ncbi:MAG TPA: alkaline phosphatase family protein, partial [Chloroflexota bacterium]|nr:alkaline phosphatase family protein [Chloroflexota bacterium]